MSADEALLAGSVTALPYPSTELCRNDPEYLRRHGRFRTVSNIAKAAFAGGGAFLIYYEWRVSLVIGGSGAWALPALTIFSVALAEFGFWAFDVAVGQGVKSASLDASGIRVMLWNRSGFDVDWGDSKFAVDIDRPPRRKREVRGTYILHFRQPKNTFGEITEMATKALVHESTRHGLRVTERRVRRDLLAKPWTITSIRNPSLPVPTRIWQ